MALRLRSGFALTVVLILARAGVASGVTERVSVASEGTEGEDDSFVAWIAPDGNDVAIVSDADNLVAGDTNENYDVFVRDRAAGTTEIVSVTPAGTPASGASIGGPMSADDRYVLFASDAQDLVAGDTNGVIDVFVRDRVAGVTTRESVADDGSEANGASKLIGISADGRWVAFFSEATNLVPDDTNGVRDVFVRDRVAGTTTRVSVASDGTPANADCIGAGMSVDGRFVVFHTAASNLDPTDTNGLVDVYLHDRDTGITSRVSIASDGTQGNADSLAGGISADGRMVVFYGEASTLVADDTNGTADVFVHDRGTGATTRVSVGTGGVQANGPSYGADISGDGRVVAFHSLATDLAPGDTNGAFDVFVHDLTSGATVRASVDSAGFQALGTSDSPRLSYDGDVVAYHSFASNLVPGDGNGTDDVFVFDRRCGNGVLDAGEQCDDGNDVNGDGCDDDCVPSICTGGTSVVATVIKLKQLGGVPGDEQLTVSGNLLFPPGAPAVVDPSSTGVQFRLADLGRPGTAVFDLSLFTAPVPPGGKGSGCSPKDGWKLPGSSSVYANRSGGIDPPTCTPASARGLVSLRIKDKRTTRGSVAFKVTVKGASIALPVTPLRAELVLGADAASGAAGACGTARLAATSCLVGPTLIRCR